MMSNYQGPMNSCDQFRAAMRDAGLSGVDHIEADEQIHRFRVEGDKPGSRNGWYVNFGNVGAFGSWKEGVSHTFSSKDRRYMSGWERQEFQKQIRRMCEAKDKARRKSQDAAAAKCLELWNQASPACPEHGYLIKKQVKPYGLRQRGDVLVVPVVNAQGELRSLQRIYASGDKRFFPDGEITGCYCSIGELTDIVYLCEGWATGATINESSGCGVAVAFNAGNLKPVALNLRRKFPSQKFIIAADNDHAKPTNTGLAKGREAAATAGMQIVFPTFPSGSTGTDFNDLSILQGDMT